MSRYRILSAAEEELAAAALFYEEAAIGVGLAFLDQIQSTIERLCADLLSGAAIGAANMWSMLVPTFPFSLIYVVESQVVIIVAVAHHRRMPGYWNSRITE